MRRNDFSDKLFDIAMAMAMIAFAMFIFLATIAIAVHLLKGGAV